MTGILCLVVLGCGTKSPISKDIVGTWTFDQAAPGVEALAYFNKDGTYRFTFIGNKIDNAVSGTYKLTNGTMEMNQTGAVRNGAIDSKKNLWSGRVEWQDNDHINMIHDGDRVNATYTRKK